MLGGLKFSIQWVLNKILQINQLTSYVTPEQFMQQQLQQQRTKRATYTVIHCNNYQNSCSNKWQRPKNIDFFLKQ